MWCLKVKMLSGRNTQKYQMLEASCNNLFQEVLGKTCPCNNKLSAKLIRYDVQVSSIKAWWMTLYKVFFPFSSDIWIQDLETYILILQAEDDQTIPIELGRKLFRWTLHCKYFASKD